MITLDFETYYDKEYSLSKMTTEEYIRDPRFQVIGVGVRNKAGSAWITGTDAQIARELQKLNLADDTVLCHNTMFDGAILGWRYNIYPVGYFDTLCMARAVDGVEAGNSLAKLAERYGVGKKGFEVALAMGKRREDFSEADMDAYGKYCLNDVEITRKLFLILKQYFSASELRLMDLTIKMFTRPRIVVDATLLKEHLQELRDKKEKLLSEANVGKDVLMSNEKLAALLIGWGVDVPIKVSPTTGKLTYALAKKDEAFVALLEHEQLRVQAVVGARLGVKSTLDETRTQRLIDISSRGSLPVPLKYYAAHTGRWGGDDKVNLQNLPKKSKLKESMLPPDGYVFVDADSSQIEARVLAWLSGQMDLVDAFANGVDVYRMTASYLFNVSISKVTDDQRFIGKTVVLGCGYGLGSKKFHEHMKSVGRNMDLLEAAVIIKQYRNTYPYIPMLWAEADRCLYALASKELKTSPFGKRPNAVRLLPGIGFDLPNGIPLKYNDIEEDVEETNKRQLKSTRLGGNREDFMQYRYKSRNGYVKIYGGKVVENICQALARNIIAEQMLAISEKYEVVLTVHDSVVCIVKKSEQEEACELIQNFMRRRPAWAQDLPLNCEVKYGDNYGNTEKYVHVVV